jgi:beta-lactamase superfamily II metal-dependent hydrolase
MDRRLMVVLAGAWLVACAGKSGDGGPAAGGSGAEGGSGGASAGAGGKGGSSGSGGAQPSGGSPGTGGGAGGGPGTGGGQGGAAPGDASMPAAGGAMGQDAANKDATAPPPPDGPPAAGKPLRIYWIDVEGGASTLVVTPSGDILLADAGWTGTRDVNRIVAVLEKEVGRKQIDYFVATHYHVDHVGGVPALAAAVPIAAFLDHGASVEGGADFTRYQGAIGNAKRVTVQAGMRMALGAVEITIVSAAGKVVDPLASAAANPACPGPQKTDEPDEDPQSVGFLARYGKFDFVDLGDLTWGVESRLACPMNRLGAVEIFQTSQHGSNESNAPQLVHGLQPLVVVMNNGATKGGSASTFGVIKASPGLKDLWQVHLASNVPADMQTEEGLIANAGGPDQAHWLRATIEADGSFTVTNGRTAMSRSYQSR